MPQKSQKRPNLVPQKSPFPAKTGSGAWEAKTVIFELPESIEKPVCGDERGSGQRIENWLF